MRVSAEATDSVQYTIRLTGLSIDMNTARINALDQPLSRGAEGVAPAKESSRPTPRARRSQAERSEDTQLKLCQAAVALLTEVGYANLTTALIAERAGVSKGAMAHHFPTKDDMMVAAIRHLVAEWEQGWAAYPSLAAQSEQLAQLQHSLWHDIFGRLEYLAALEVVLSARHLPALHARLRAEVKDWVTARDAAFARCIPLDDRAELSTFLSLNSCVMRGLATSMETSSDESSPPRVMALWSEIASAYLAKRGAAALSPSTPSPGSPPKV